MNTSIYLKPDLADRINKFMNSSSGMNKNKLINIALEEYLDKHENNYEWSSEFLAWGEKEDPCEGLEIDRTDWREINL